ncbi:hypothetical protein ACEOWJ_001770 [Bacillus cereus]
MRCFMVKVFGEKNTFAIQYEFLNNPFNERGWIGETWGSFQFFVNGKDICQYKRKDTIVNYQWNVMYIVEWFSENLKHILSTEPFPLPVEGRHSIELLENCLEFDSDNEDEFDEWFDKKQDWEFKHSWFSSRAGSFFPDVFFRRVGDEIEIAWNNESTYISEGVSFINSMGFEYVPSSIFEVSVKNFIENFLDNLMQNSKHKINAKEICGKIKKSVE